MSLVDFDATATARRIQDIADAARKAFEAHAEQSEQLNAAAREAAAKEQAELEASEKRRAEAEAKAAEAADEKTEDEQPKTPPKPSTLSLGAEEFKLDREARRAAEEPKAAESKPAESTQEDVKPTPQPAEEPKPKPRPGTTLKLGARDDDEAPVERDKPVRRGPRPSEADDDMSGRTWLR